MLKKNNRSGINGMLFILPAFIYLLLITIIPTIMLLRYAFSDWEIGDFGGIQYVGFETFQQVLANPITVDNFRATIVFVVSAVVIELILGLLIALALVKNFRGATLIRTLMIAPVISVPIGVGFIWRYILHPDLGVMNWAMAKFGLPYIQWFGAKPWAMWSVVIADIWQWTPFVMLILLAGLVTIPQSLYEAAEMDGATKFQQFIHVTLPLLLPTIIVATILRFIWAMKSFDTIFAMTRGGPGTYTSILNFEIYKEAFQKFHTSYAAALSVLLLIVVIIMTKIAVSFMKDEK
ncbi:MAG: sugar ABC transporter permease [Alphaproteobacteria bacterium]|nr:sugar ABC transporter permease [Alphaproteobacteria bacterium]